MGGLLWRVSQGLREQIKPEVFENKKSSCRSCRKTSEAGRARTDDDRIMSSGL